MVGRTRCVQIQGNPDSVELVTTARLNVRGSQAHMSMQYFLTYWIDSSLFIAGLDHRPIKSSHDTCRLKTLRRGLLIRYHSGMVFSRRFHANQIINTHTTMGPKSVTYDMNHKNGSPIKTIPPPNIDGIVINMPTTINATTTPVQEHLVAG